MAACVIIPARLASTRFPEKILASRTGRPLVQHVVDQAHKCRRVRQVIVACDSQRVVEALRPFGTRCELTDPELPSGTDRIAAVARGLDDDIIVNVQGDEPEIEPATIDALVERLENSADDMATAATPFPAGADVADPNLVKVVRDLSGRAMYFSRAAIPLWRDGPSPQPSPSGRGSEPGPSPRSSPASSVGGVADPASHYLHLGIYAYRRPFLLEFAGWPPTPCERAEKLEQLRALEHGRSIHVIVVQRRAHGIDTLRQYEDFVRRWNASIQ